MRQKARASTSSVVAMSRRVNGVSVGRPDSDHVGERRAQDAAVRMPVLGGRALLLRLVLLGREKNRQAPEVFPRAHVLRRRAGAVKLLAVVGRALVAVRELAPDLLHAQRGDLVLGARLHLLVPEASVRHD